MTADNWSFLGLTSDFGWISKLDFSQRSAVKERDIRSAWEASATYLSMFSPLAGCVSSTSLLFGCLGNLFQDNSFKALPDLCRGSRGQLFPAFHHLLLHLLILRSTASTFNQLNKVKGQMSTIWHMGKQATAYMHYMQVYTILHIHTDGFSIQEPKPNIQEKFIKLLSSNVWNHHD